MIGRSDPYFMQETKQISLDQMALPFSTSMENKYFDNISLAHELLNTQEHQNKH